MVEIHLGILEEGKKITFVIANLGSCVRAFGRQILRWLVQR